MKIRTGFVSNSSSSSFVVRFKTLYREDFQKQLEDVENQNLFADRSVVRKLKRNGFQWVKEDDPLRIEISPIPFEKFVETDLVLRAAFQECIKRSERINKKHNWGSPTWESSFYKFERHFKNTLAKQVACNEDEVITFLLKNNVPFTAATHYGHWVYIYEKDSPYMIRLPVYASKVLMYGDYEEVKRAFKKDRVKHIGPRAEKIYVKECLQEMEEEWDDEDT